MIKIPKEPFRGMMPIMPTAITETGDLDEKSQRRLVHYCLDCGAVAIGHFGFASEFHKIPEDHRRQLIQIIVNEVSGRVPVFIGVTAPSNRMAVNYAKEAESLGADMLMASIPYVNVPDARGTFEYYSRLSEAVSLPIIIQDAGHSASVLTPDLVYRMYCEIERVHYIKAEGKDFLAKTAALTKLSGGKLPIIGGAGGKHMIHMLRLGVTAFMTGTEALDIHASVVDAYLAGDEEEAARIYYERILPYFMFYIDYSEELLKWMLHTRGVMDCPKVLSPPAAPPMSDIERQELNWVLERIGWKKGWEEEGQVT